MKVSMLCGVHYEGAAAHLNAPPVAPSVCDPVVAKQSFDHFLEYAAMADEFGFDWISVSEHHSSPLILSSSIMPLWGALTQIVKRARIALLGPLAPISNPVRVAEEIAVLDQLSNGASARRSASRRRLRGRMSTASSRAWLSGRAPSSSRRRTTSSIEASSWWRIRMRNAPVDSGHRPNSGAVPFGAGRMLFSGSPELRTPVGAGGSA